MTYKYNNKLRNFSRSNRKMQTDAEKLLWFHLRRKKLHGYKFRRQFPLAMYILDFYCIDKKIAIELDGSKHMQRKFYDDKRTNYLQTLGIRVIRVWDNDVLLNIKSVLEKILLELENQ